LDLIAQLDEIAGRAGGKQTTIAVVTTQFWPLPWYLRDYKNVGYYDHVIPTSSTVVIASPKQITELMPSLAGRYRLAGSYPLRPGAYLLLFVANNELP
jgi:predicted membrane-bound mannosyltransferase